MSFVGVAADSKRHGGELTEILAAPSRSPDTQPIHTTPPPFATRRERQRVHPEASTHQIRNPTSGTSGREL